MKALRDDASDVLDQVADPGTFLKELVRAAEMLRGWKAVSDENRLADRRRNLSDYGKRLKGEIKAPVPLSAVNRVYLAKLGRSRELSEASELELVEALLARLMAARTGRGDHPHDELDFAALLVRAAYERHTGKTATSTKQGDYIVLLNSVVQVAKCHERKDMHRVAERVLTKGELLEESPGVTLLVPPRLSDL